MRNRSVILIVWVALLSFPLSAETRSEFASRVKLNLSHETFDLSRSDEVARLGLVCGKLIEQAKADASRWSDQKKSLLEKQPLEKFSREQLEMYFHEPKGSITKRESRGLEYAKHLCDRLGDKDNPSRTDLLWELVEVLTAINQNRTPPGPRRIDFVEMPFVFLDYKINPVGVGKIPAKNLAAGSPEDTDPQASTFWEPRSSAEADLYAGFGRSERPRYEEAVWQYKAPKTSLGSNPGMELKSGKKEMKVKFGETISEPFTARIFHAMGFHVDATDYSPGIRFAYSRRFFREFHMRQEVPLAITLFKVIPVRRLALQKRYDPFAFIASAQLRSGEIIPSTELKKRLIKTRPLPEADYLDAEFDEDYEATIESLLTVPANLQLKDEQSDSVGPWMFEGLKHEHRRELRGAGLLSAWVGWFDSRFENTRLRLVERESREKVLHYFTDLGGGLGWASGPLTWKVESPNKFPWVFTESARNTRNGFRIRDFVPIDDTKAFEFMDRNDARWMARKIASLTENQITAALVASGCDSAWTRLYLEKLVSRRDQMVRDLGLEQEVALLRPAGTSLNLDYDPLRDGPVTVESPSGNIFLAPKGDSFIRKGELVTPDFFPASR